MKNEIWIPSSVIPNAYYLEPMRDTNPSNFINQETNQIPFRQSLVDLSFWNTKIPLGIGPKCLRDGETGSKECQTKKAEIGKFTIQANA